jgi:hypothetical protein
MTESISASYRTTICKTQYGTYFYFTIQFNTLLAAVIRNCWNLFLLNVHKLLQVLTIELNAQTSVVCLFFCLIMFYNFRILLQKYKANCNPTCRKPSFWGGDLTLFNWNGSLSPRKDNNERVTKYRNWFGYVHLNQLANSIQTWYASSFGKKK